MDRLIRWCGVLLLTVPMLAIADPVRLNASASGTMGADAIWLGKFTNDLSYTGGYLPFALTLTAEFDPDSPGFATFGSGDTEGVSQSNPQSLATLVIDGKSYTVEGGSSLSVSLQPDLYQVKLFFTDGSDNFMMSVFFRDPNGGFDGDPLSARELTAGGDIKGYFSSDAFPVNPDADGMWSAGGQADAASITISAIPEPSVASMLLGGLGVLLIARRRRNTHVRTP